MSSTVPALAASAADPARATQHAAVRQTITLTLGDEDDWIAAMATVACELHAAFDYFHWTGFYRAVRPDELRVGPYQGGHGCLRIALERGVCGAAARERRTQRVDDVNTFPGHIACSASSVSELVLPVISPNGRLLAVLDIDSDHPAAFSAADQRELETLCAWLGERYAETTVL